MRTCSLRRVFSQSFTGDQPLLRSACDELKTVSLLSQEISLRHMKAMEKLLMWSMREENVAIQEVINDSLDSMRIWCDVQRVFAGYINHAVVELWRACSGQAHSSSVREAEKILSACSDREAKLRKELSRATIWRKGGQVRLMELRLEEAKLQREEAKIYLQAVMAERAAVKMLCFKKAMMKLSETWALVGKCCQLVFDTQRRLVTQIPDIVQENIFSMYYTPDENVAATLEQLKERLGEIVLSDQDGPGRRNTRTGRSQANAMPSYSA